MISSPSTDNLDRLFPRLNKFLSAREEWSLLARLPGEGAPREVLEWHRRDCPVSRFLALLFEGGLNG